MPTSRIATVSSGVWVVVGGPVHESMLRRAVALCIPRLFPSDCLAVQVTRDCGADVSNTQELFRCKADLTKRQDVVVQGPDGSLKINLVWSDKTRGKLRVMNDRLSFKNMFLKPFEIPYGDIKTAFLLSSKIAFVKFYVLWIVYNEGYVGMGFLRDSFWDGPLPFSVIRENARFSKADILKTIATSAVTGLVGEVAGGALGSASLAGEATGLAAKVTASQVSEAAIEKAGGVIKGKSSKGAAHKPQLSQYVVQRGTQTSKAMTRDHLIKLVQRGGVRPNDQILDITANKRISTKTLIEKYG